MTSTLDTVHQEVFPFSKTQFFTENKGYFTYKVNQGDTLIETNSGAIYRKIKKNQ